MSLGGDRVDDARPIGDMSDDELRAMADEAEIGLATLQGIITVMATRLAGYDTD